jgi:hypothetical protein
MELDDARERVRCAPHSRWGLPIACHLTDGDAEQIGELGGGLNQVSSDFGAGQTICLSPIKTPYPYS